MTNRDRMVLSLLANLIITNVWMAAENYFVGAIWLILSVLVALAVAATKD